MTVEYCKKLQLKVKNYHFLQHLKSLLELTGELQATQYD